MTQGRCRGFGLVEIMVALVLSALLSLGITSLILNAQRHFWHEEQLGELYANGRFAMQIVQRELRMAGFFGYAFPGAVRASIGSEDDCYLYVLGPAQQIEHFDNLNRDGLSATRASLPAQCRREDYYQEGSDAVLVRRVWDRPHRLRGESLEPVSELTTYLRGETAAAEFALGPGDSDNLWRYSPYLLFVRKHSLAPADRIPNLCRLRLSPLGARMAPVECLVEGVENLQLAFALDTDNDRKADTWVSEPTPEQLHRALLVRITLSMRSVLPLSSTGDFLRHEMVGVALLRNSDVLRT